MKKVNMSIFALNLIIVINGMTTQKYTALMFICSLAISGVVCWDGLRRYSPLEDRSYRE